MWSDLTIPWQTCIALAWEAYCDDCIPIGAVVTGTDGNVLSLGRNRIYERVKRGEHRNGAALAHAEVEALRHLDLDAMDPHSCILYSTTEPCPMCMGTLYMSGVRKLVYAARDPYAGSTNMLGTTWYLQRKPIKVSGPIPHLETIITAMFVEQEANIHDGGLPDGLFWEMHKQVVPEGVSLGMDMAAKGTLRTLREQGANAEEIYDMISSQVK